MNPVVHSRDDEGVGMAPKIVSPKTSLDFPDNEQEG